MTIANNTIEKLINNELLFKSSENGSFQPVSDNSEVIEFLQDEAVQTQDICDQETYTFSDGSYITRSLDDYFTGKDIDDFLITQELG